MTVAPKRPVKIRPRRTGVVATLALLASGVALATAPPASAAAPECGPPIVAGTTATVTCNFTDAAQQWTVPAGVTRVTFDVYGAQGDGFPVEGFNGGRGGRSIATMDVTPGEVLEVFVGGSTGVEQDTFGNFLPSGGFNGGGDPGSFCIFTATGPFCSRSGFGGGGASDVRRAPYGLADRLIVAGGGGGLGSESAPGAGGGPAGSSAVLSGDPEGRTPGAGGNQDGSSGSGQLGEGSQAGTISDGVNPGYDGGGGGGGYYGGDGGYGASGGGGSGFTADGTGMTTGVRDGTGVVIITYTVAVPPKESQAALTVTSVSGTFGTPLTLSTSGGSGTGAVSYTATNGTATGCAATGSTLTSNSAGSCVVTATKAADSDFTAVSSGPTTVTFGKAPQALLTVTSTAGTTGTPLTLTTSGGSGTGTTTYSAVDGSAADCSVNGSTLTTTSAGTCTVTATKAGDSNFLPAASTPTSITLDAAPATQAPLFVTSTSGTFLTPLPLTTSGGSGSGGVTFEVVNGSATGCSVTAGTITSSSAGTCIVTASRAGDVTYGPVSSDPTTITFGKAAQDALSVTSTNGTYGNPLPLTTSGGSGTGAVSFSTMDGSASGCAVNGATLTSTSSGTCSVTATKATDTNYLPTSTTPTAVTLMAGTQAPLHVTSTTVISGAPLSTSGGSGTGAVTFAADNGTASGCAINGTTVSATTIGTCVVTATKAGGGGFAPTASVPTAVTVLYATTGFSAPKRTVTRSGSTITVKFALTDINGVSVSNAAGQALADAGAVQVRLNGPGAGGPIVVSATCDWNRVKRWFECSLRTTKELTSGVSYYLTAYENPSTGLVTVPTIRNATNPLAIRFR